MTFRIGVLPTPSRNTPTPTSILSGRGSALTSAIRPISGSSATGSRSARPRAFASVRVSMEGRLASLRVVIHSDSVTEGYRLAGQHIAGRNFFIGQPVSGRHFDLALGYLCPAGRADPGLAGEGSGKPGSAGAVEDIGGCEGHFARAAVERDGDTDPGGLRLKLLHLASHRFGRPIGGKTLDVDPILGDIAVEQHPFRRIHHRSRPADEPAVDLRGIGNQC